jgi:hypothetical protein
MIDKAEEALKAGRCACCLRICKHVHLRRPTRRSASHQFVIPWTVFHTMSLMFLKAKQLLVKHVWAVFSITRCTYPYLRMHVHTAHNITVQRSTVQRCTLYTCMHSMVEETMVQHSAAQVAGAAAAKAAAPPPGSAPRKEVKPQERRQPRRLRREVQWSLSR